VKLAVNCSYQAIDLLREKKVHFDYFKCPAWPDVVAVAKDTRPVYVHFPLAAGRGIGDALNAETGQPTDWHAMEILLAETNTPLVNLHLGVNAEDHPNLPASSVDPDVVDTVVENMIRDVRAVVERFGPEKVIVENIGESGNRFLRPTYLPEVIAAVIEETGCGLLLDTSHARLAAYTLGMDAQEYIGLLPVQCIRELHITGIQPFEGKWVELARRAGVDEGTIKRLVGRLIDHLPMTDADWEFFAWSIQQIRVGVWGRPWFVTFEYGGTSPKYRVITDSEVLADQVPRLYAIVKGDQLGGSGCRRPETGAFSPGDG
jgi:uncharacterized protein (UPF0276 family)